MTIMYLVYSVNVYIYIQCCDQNKGLFYSILLLFSLLVFLQNTTDIDTVLLLLFIIRATVQTEDN